MNTIKFNPLNFTLLILLIVLVYSCGKKNSISKEAEPNSLSTYTSSTPEDLNPEIKDSLNNLKIQIEKLSQQSQETSSNVKKMEASIKTLGNIEFWIWFTLGISIMCLFISIIVLSKYSEVKRKLDRNSDKIRSIINDIREFTFQAQSNSKGLRSNEHVNLQIQINNLEQSIRNLQDYLNDINKTPIHHKGNINSASISNQVQEGYFGLPVKTDPAYFNNFLPSKQPEARFSVEISNNKAIFKPFENNQFLNSYLSSDTVRVAITFIGDTKTATNMIVIQEGEATYRNERWYITNKAIVKLS